MIGHVYGYLHRIGGMLFATPFFLGGLLVAGAILYFGQRRKGVRRKPSEIPDDELQTGNMFLLTGRSMPWRL